MDKHVEPLSTKTKQILAGMQHTFSHFQLCVSEAVSSPIKIKKKEALQDFPGLRLECLALNAVISLQWQFSSQGAPGCVCMNALDVCVCLCAEEGKGVGVGGKRALSMSTSRKNLKKKKIKHVTRTFLCFSLGKSNQGREYCKSPNL